MYDCRPMTADEIFEKAMATMAPLPSQESCARDLAEIFSFHLVKNKLMDAGFSCDELPQQHAMMVAPTGAGKTYLLRHVAKVCGVNMIFMDGSSMSRDGWKGTSFSQQLLSAKNAARDNGHFARSVIFVDEIDKMRLYGDRSDAGNAMDNLLQLFNGGGVAVELADRQTDTLDVSRFTIIMGGAFAGLEEIIRKRIAPRAGIGFGASSVSCAVDDRTILQQTTPEDLQAYGMKKELIARIGSIVHINPLGLEDYRRLLTAEVGSVQANYRNFFAFGYGVDFEVSDDAVRYIAVQCSKATTGARAVNPIVNNVMRKAVSQVARDGGINKIVLAANDKGCFLQYESGKRGVSGIETPAFSDAAPWCLSGKSVCTVANRLCKEYREAGCSAMFASEFKVFVSMTLTYLDSTCRSSELTFDNLRKLAATTDKPSNIGSLSPFEIIISDTLQNPNHAPSLDRFYQDYRKLWTPDTCRRLCKALTLIRQQLIRKHNSPHITFNIIKQQSVD